MSRRSCSVLFRRRPAWLVGEDQAERDARIADGASAPAAPAGARYPGDYAGFAVSVAPEGHAWGPGDLGDPNRETVTLELTDEERICLATRAKRIDPDTHALLDVTFDDRYGAVAEVLRRNFDDPEKAEREQAEESGGFPGSDGWRFGEIVALNRRTLPATEVHSGAGLYEVGPGKTYSTIQSALDQLWTDQGSAEFTAAQEIRIYDSTYTETVAVNGGLRPTWFYRLIIKAASGNDSVVVTNSGLGDTTFHTNAVDAVTFQDLEIRNEAPGGYYALYAISNSVRIFNCVFDGNGVGQYGIRGPGAGYGLARGCQIKGFVSNGTWYVTKVERCFFDNCKYYQQVGTGSVESCIFDGANAAVTWWAAIQNPVSEMPISVINCTFFSVTSVFVAGGGTGHKAANLRVRNCVFSGCGTVYSAEGGRFDADFNCYHNCTKVAVIDGTDYTTLVDWQAFSDVDGNSPDANSIDQDPKLSDPAGGDFSIPKDSPCARGGAGAGVRKDFAGGDFCGHHPDIGARSTGTAGAPQTPSVTITGVQGSTVSLSVSGEEAATHHAELVSARTGAVVDEDSREGDGALSLVAPDVGARYFVSAWSANASGRSEPAAPLEIFLPAGDAPFEEVRVALVARLAAHAGLQEVLGTDESGAVPIYAARPGLPVRVPSVVYTLEGTPDSALDRAGRWYMKLALEAWGGSPGVNDSIVSAMDEVLSREPFDCTSWSVKRIRRTGDGTDWTGDGRTESRRTEWAFVADRLDS